MSIAEWLTTMLQSGASSLASYLAAHVLLCLVPAFFIAGAMTALIPKEAITRYLGRDASKWVSYPMAALGGFVLAVCSCTILPLFAGIYRQGAGLGPAITFLFVGPAINILAVSYTGVAIGMDIAVARIILSALFGVGIGLIMAFVYRRDDHARADVPAAVGGAFANKASIQRAPLVFLLLLLAGLVVGTLAVDLLTNTYAQVTLPLGDTAQWQATLDRLVPYDASQGQEGVSVQGVLLIGLLVLIGVTAWLGLNTIDEGFNAWSWAALALIAVTLLVAALQFTATAERIADRHHRAICRRGAGSGGCGLGGLEVAGRLRGTGVALGDLALCQADLSVAHRRGVPCRYGSGAHPARPHRVTRRAEHVVGQRGRRGLWRVHVLSDAGGGAHCQHVPGIGNASRPAAGLPDGRSGVERAEHPDHGQGHRQEKDVDLCGSGGDL